MYSIIKVHSSRLSWLRNERTKRQFSGVNFILSGADELAQCVKELAGQADHLSSVGVTEPTSYPSDFCHMLHGSSESTVAHVLPLTQNNRNKKLAIFPKASACAVTS